MFRTDLLTGQQLYDLYQEDMVYDENVGKSVFQSFKDIEFLRVDKLMPGFSIHDIQNYAFYLCVFQDDLLVGVRKFYENPKRKQEMNKILGDTESP
jgi:hypothetical protein